MRFWGKGRQGEKKPSREKLATQSELLELYPDQGSSGREMISSLQLEEGKSSDVFNRAFRYTDLTQNEIFMLLMHAMQ